MAVYDLSFLSANEMTSVCAWEYIPIGTPRAIVQIVHGFGEHSRRYLHLIVSLVEHGFIVVADDHIGNGKTAYDAACMGKSYSKGYGTFIKDEKKLHDLTVSKYPNLPYFMFGHSWGSMIAREYCTKYPSDLKALLLCGLVSEMKGCVAEYNDSAFRKAATENPQESGERWSEKVFLDMNSRISNPKTSIDWVAKDEDVLTDQLNDIYNVFSCSTEMLWDFVELHQRIESDVWFTEVPAKLPVLVMYGENDPCSNYGKGVAKLKERLSLNGNPVIVKCYQGYRHDIHQEPELKSVVEANIIDYIDKIILP